MNAYQQIRTRIPRLAQQVAKRRNAAWKALSHGRPAINRAGLDRKQYPAPQQPCIAVKHRRLAPLSWPAVAPTRQPGQRCHGAAPLPARQQNRRREQQSGFEEVVVHRRELEVCHDLPPRKPAAMERPLRRCRTLQVVELEVHKALQAHVGSGHQPNSKRGTHSLHCSPRQATHGKQHSQSQ